MIRNYLLLLSMVGLAACSDSGSTVSNTMTFSNISPTVTYQSSTAKTSVLAVGNVDCPTGGILIETGIDINANGLLDVSEVSKTQKVCNGTVGAAGVNGANGLNALVTLTKEVEGANCHTGGVRIDTGMDTNRSGILDATEITATSYACNGSGGVTGSGTIWVDVTGTAQQTASNTGYLADNPARVTLTLPAAPALGDIIQVTGVGAGGWKVAQNAGQSILTTKIPETLSALWTSHTIKTTALYEDWYIASSSDGHKLVVAQEYGQIYTSTDSGVTWVPRMSNAGWTGIASSADGVKLVAVANIADNNSGGGQIFTSSDSGVTWILRKSITATTQSLPRVVSSADGTKLAALIYGQLYTSADSGVTWIAPPSAMFSGYSLASSADGSKLVVGAGNSINTSKDFGMTWTISMVGGADAVASSADGTKLFACNPFKLYTSADSGATWTTLPGVGGSIKVVSSADGTTLLVLGSSSYTGDKTTATTIYISKDSGNSWVSRPFSEASAVALTSDGAKQMVLVRPMLVNGTAVEGDVVLMTSAQQTSIGTGGTITGEQYDAVDLQYVGNNTFTVRSYSGGLAIQ